MEIKHLDTFEEFDSEVEKLRDYIVSSKKFDNQALSTLLFRGQSISNWGLETTLERRSSTSWSVKRYDILMHLIRPAVVSLTEKNWDLDNYENPEFLDVPPNYAFMIYCRHHGFPSPLLDWSQSPYVALYFAYANARTEEDVAIYCYIESLDGGKGGWVGAPKINQLGSYVVTHPRHFAQQSQYTISIKHNDQDNWTYCPHTESFGEASKDRDLLFKFVLPGSLRIKMLSRLNQMNINAFTLFANEDGLMEMLAQRQIDTRGL